MNAIAAALAGTGFRVARFEFGYMASRRTSEGGRKPPPRAETLIKEYTSPPLPASARPGCSSSAASRWADASPACLPTNSSHAGRIAGLLCLGYPFHPPGKPEQLRTKHLAGLKIPVLICQGTRDIFGSREEVAEYGLSKKIEVLWLEDGDHDLKPRKGISGFTAADHLKTVAEAVSA